VTELQVENIISAIPLPAVVVDARERIMASNAEALTLLGHSAKGRHFATSIRQPAVAEAIEAVLQDAQPRQTRYTSNDGTQEVSFEVHCRSVIALTPRPGVLVTFQDVTHMEQAGQMRRDFVANVSHELRTPLTALMGFIETLRGPAKDDEAARERFLSIMDNEARRMNRLVGDLLSLSRVEGQERVRPRETLDLLGLLQSTIKSITPLATDAGVALHVDAPNAPITITGDSDQLRQVFTNLIENGIKYGGSGERVDLNVSLSDHDPALRAAGVRVKVIDQGPGIEPVHLPRLTERFYRADSHRSRELGGTGLGLAIVKHIVNRHRGRLRVESELGQGAAFTVILPRKIR
jgi:two-component system phosphate regulon sensor histidine kinase PhoR